MRVNKYWATNAAAASLYLLVQGTVLLVAARAMRVNALITGLKFSPILAVPALGWSVYSTSRPDSSFSIKADIFGFERKSTRQAISEDHAASLTTKGIASTFIWSSLNISFSVLLAKIFPRTAWLAAFQLGLLTPGQMASKVASCTIASFGETKVTRRKPILAGLVHRPDRHSVF